MYQKLCPKCHKPSFSSYDTGSWMCPSCNNNLTYVTPQDTAEVQPKRPQLYIIKKQDAVKNHKMKPYVFQSFD
jgi:uncharacterized Zn finger protein (UPF0148 family)